MLNGFSREGCLFIFRLRFLSRYFILLPFCMLLFFSFVSCKNDISATYFDSQERFVTQLNLKNSDDDYDNNK